jgi:hypothetical protein
LHGQQKRATPHAKSALDRVMRIDGELASAIYPRRFTVRLQMTSKAGE